MLKNSKADLERKLSEVSFEASPLYYIRLRIDHLEAEEQEGWPREQKERLRETTDWRRSRFVQVLARRQPAGFLWATIHKAFMAIGTNILQPVARNGYPDTLPASSLKGSTAGAICRMDTNPFTSSPVNEGSASQYPMDNSNQDGDEMSPSARKPVKLLKESRVDKNIPG